MYRVISWAAIMAVLLSGSIYAKPGPQGSGKKGPQMHQEGPGMDREGGFGEYGMLIRIAGLETIKEKYDIQMKRIMLDSKEASLTHKAKKRELMQEVAVLSAKYDSDPQVIGTQISRLLEQISAIEVQMSDLRNQSMEKIHKLHQEEQKELRKGVQEWMKTLSKDPSEMKRFTDHVNMMHQKMQPKAGK